MKTLRKERKMKGKKIFLVSFICISFMITAVPAAQTKKVSKVDGSVTISGALNGSFKWKEDLALFCGCVPDVKVGKIEVTMTDGAGTFIAIDASMDGELTLTSGKLKDTLKGKGKAGTCSAKGTTESKVDLPLDVTVKGKSGATATLKGRLACQQSYGG